MVCSSCGGELQSGICPLCEQTRIPTDETGGGLATTEPDRPRGEDGTPLARAPASPSKAGPRRHGPAAARFDPGTLLAGRYRIVSALGRGGMGEVYRADDLKLGESVALKFLPASVERDPQRLEALLEEARVARRISHPNICRVHDIAETEDGLHFISMEYVDGEDLASLLRRIGRMPRSKALEIARESLHGLAAAHDAGILHRDVKPANLMLDGAGRVRITDFGLAGGLGAGPRGGTPAYMAPEIHDGQRGSTQSDLYALGLVFYELFTGRRAFQATSRERLARLHRTADPPAPSEAVGGLDPELDELILRCLDKNPARRPALAEVDRILEGLQQVGETSSSRSREPAEPASFSLWRPRAVSRRRLAGLVAIVAVASLALFLALSRVSRQGEAVSPSEAVSSSEAPAPEAQIVVENSRPGLALLPIRHLNEDPEARWIGLAVVEILFSELAAGDSQRVVPLHQVDEALVELGLSRAETYSSADLQRLRRRLGVERVLLGSHSEIAQDAAAGLLRVDLRIVDVGDGSVVATHGATGTASQLFDLVLRVGEALRGELAVNALSPEEILAVRRALPEDTEAAKAYVEGRAALRRLDFDAARRRLTLATEIEPEHALAHAALAKAWWKLGYETRAREAIGRAVHLAEVLGSRDQREIRARAARYENRLDDAVPLLEGLIHSDPAQLDYHVELVQTQLERGAYAEARVALARARKLPAPLGDQPIFDYLEARIHGLQGHYAEQRRLARSAAEKAERIGSSTLVAKARLNEALAHGHLGEVEAETRALEQARALYERLGDRFGMARCLQHMGNSLYQRGDLDGGERVLLRARELYVEIGHDLNVGTVSLSLAVIESLRGDADSSIARLEEAARLFERIGNEEYRARALNNLGATLQRRGDLRAAMQRYGEAFEIFSALGNRANSALLLTNVGEIQFLLGDLEEARRTFGEVQAMVREIGDREGLGYVTYQLAEVYRARGEDFIALARYEEALEILEQVKDDLTASEVRLGLARIALERRQPGRAEDLARQAEQFFRSVGASELEALAATIRGRAVLQRAGAEAARRLVDELRARVDSRSPPRLRFSLDLLEARVLRAEGSADGALALLSRLADDARAVGRLESELEARVEAAEIEAEQRPASGQALRDLLGEVERRGYGALAERASRSGGRP